jgi:hypothetical protein
LSSLMVAGLGATLVALAPAGQGPGGTAILTPQPGENLAKEEIETGALDRMMQTPPAADETGIIWSTWEGTDQD